MMVPFPPWRPDLPALGKYSQIALNLVPHKSSYKPFPSLAAYSTALTGRCRGAFAAQDKDGNARIFSGDATKLYEVVDTTQTDRSKVGGYTITADEDWQFAKLNEQIIAVSIDAVTQALTMGSSAFADLITSTLKPKARCIDVVRPGFVVLGNTDEGGTRFSNRVRWSAIGDATNFDQSAVTQSDAQDVEGGWVQAVVGGEFGLVFTERFLHRMSYVGSPNIFQFDEIARNAGLYGRRALVKHNHRVYYLSDDGFQVTDGSTVVPIGVNKVDEFFLSDLDHAYRDRISCAIDPDNHLIVWAYTTDETSGDGIPDKMMAYNYSTGEWSQIDVDVEVLLSALTIGYTLDSLDSISPSIDDLAFSLDSRVWTGGASIFGAFNNQHKLGFFNGSAMTATIDTSEMQFTPMRKSLVKRVRPLVDQPGSVTITPMTRDRQQDSVTTGSAVSVNSNGFATVLKKARYHRHRAEITGGFTDAQGLDIEAVQAGKY